VTLSRAAGAEGSYSVGPVIADIQESGVTGLRGLARALEARGIPTARGGQWDARTVANVLRWIGGHERPVIATKLTAPPLRGAFFASIGVGIMYLRAGRGPAYGVPVRTAIRRR
jgi:hypothetical protein